MKTVLRTLNKKSVLIGALCCTLIIATICWALNQPKPLPLTCSVDVENRAITLLFKQGIHFDHHELKYGTVIEPLTKDNTSFSIVNTGREYMRVYFYNAKETLDYYDFEIHVGYLPDSMRLSASVAQWDKFRDRVAAETYLLQ